MCFIILVKFPAARNRFNQAYGSELYDRNSRKSFKNFDLVVTQLIGIERPCFSRKKSSHEKNIWWLSDMRVPKCNIFQKVPLWKTFGDSLTFSNNHFCFLLTFGTTGHSQSIRGCKWHFSIWNFLKVLTRSSYNSTYLGVLEAR